MSVGSGSHTQDVAALQQEHSASGPGPRSLPAVWGEDSLRAVSAVTPAATQMRALPEAVSQVVAGIRGVSGVRRVILFGSRARGDARERSDVDLAIEGPELSQRDWLAIVEATENADTLLRIDLIRLEEASPSLRERILAEGRLLG